MSMLLSPISDSARLFQSKNNQSGKISAILMSWVLHSMTTNDTRAALKAYTHDSPANIIDTLKQCRFDIRLYKWKIAALLALQGKTALLENTCRRGVEELTAGNRIYTLRPPKVEQPLSLEQGEKILSQALNDVKPVILSLYKRKVGCVTRLMHGDALGMLKERAVLTYRWEFPFCRNPGATLNAAVSNYANNIVRDASAASRSTFTGKKSDGNLTCITQSLDSIEYMYDPTSHVSDLQFDLETLTPFDQSVVQVLLYEVDEVAKNVKEIVAERLGVPTIRVSESFLRLKYYLTGAPSHTHSVVNYW
jgi:hypothetical protein